MAKRLALLLIVLVVIPCAFAQSVTRRRSVAHPPPCGTLRITAASGVTALAVDAAYVYYADFGGVVRRVAKSGGAPQVVATVAGAPIYALAVDEQNVYFPSRDERNGVDSVYGAGKAGGQPRALISPIRPIVQLIPDGDWLYVLSVGSLRQPPWPSDGRLVRVRKDATAVEDIATALRAPIGFRIDGDTIYFTEAGTSPADLTGAVRTVAKSGGIPSTLAQIPMAWGLAHDAASLYVLRVTGSDRGDVYAVSKEAGTVVPLVDSVSFEPYEPMEVSRGLLVFMNLATTSTMRIETIRASGGERRVIREFARNYPSFAVDSCAVYFSTPDGIERAPY